MADPASTTYTKVMIDQKDNLLPNHEHRIPSAEELEEVRQAVHLSLKSKSRHYLIMNGLRYTQIGPWNNWRKTIRYKLDVKGEEYEISAEERETTDAFLKRLRGTELYNF